MQQGALVGVGGSGSGPGLLYWAVAQAAGQPEPAGLGSRGGGEAGLAAAQGAARAPRWACRW